MILLAVGAACLGLFLTFWFWHSPVRRKLTPPEIDRYLGAIDRQVFLPEDDKPKALARLRAWAEADDGRPFYMLNLMRYYPELQPFPGTPNFQGTSEQANQLYEQKIRQLLFKRCGYPMLAGRTQGKSLMEVPPAMDCWGRVLVVRYRNRRTFLSLVADPAYCPWEQVTPPFGARHLQGTGARPIVSPGGVSVGSAGEWCRDSLGVHPSGSLSRGVLRPHLW